MHVGSPAVTIGAVGEGVGRSLGEVVGVEVGAPVGVIGDWVLDGPPEGVGTTGGLVHDASVAVRAVATSRQ